MDSPSIHPSAPRGSIIFGFFVQLKNAYLCKGQQHQLLYCIMAVKMKADLRLFSGVGRICFSSGWKQNNETYICPYPWGSKFNSSSAAGGVLDSGMSGQNLVLLHKALEQALGRERGDWKGSLGSPVVLQAEKWNRDFTEKVISQTVSEAQSLSLLSLSLMPRLFLGYAPSWCHGAVRRVSVLFHGWTRNQITQLCVFPPCLSPFLQKQLKNQEFPCI